MYFTFNLKEKNIKAQQLHKDNYRVNTHFSKQFNSCYPDRQNRLDDEGTVL